MGSNLPYTDPWTVLGVSRSASREDVKAAFRRAALQCHPDVDCSPAATARFTAVKTAADSLLHHQHPGRLSATGASAAARGWDPAAAARGVTPRNRTVALWAGACLACALAFGYGAAWAFYAQQRAAAASSGVGEQRLITPEPQRRKLLAALLADKRQQQQQQQAKHWQRKGPVGEAGNVADSAD
ncbi:hypothetical protein D9Q98_008175 [Chlorella vulgaris]|uniref:J domain-containing protein n=1 Tax=Chlorella vulgaris TaxID=3077 RepID=A0A9D4TG99_CHLVU|nr:hypothetical protein D9Q98_008175 [Chlorella vulgaris]